MHYRRTNHRWPHRWPQHGRAWLLAMLAVSALFGPGSSRADDDHDRARQALEAGEVLPLRTILERVEREYPGQVIDVELERGHGHGHERWIYEVKVLRAGGNLIKLKVDAKDGRLLNRKPRAGDTH